MPSSTAASNTRGEVPLLELHVRTTHLSHRCGKGSAPADRTLQHSGVQVGYSPTNPLNVSKETEDQDVLRMEHNPPQTLLKGENLQDSYVFLHVFPI
eukprot:832446-Amphidinium_carterae.2